MAIFKRNRNQRKKQILPKDGITPPQEQLTDIEPVLSYTPDGENQLPQSAAPQETDTQGEVENIAGIFDAAGEAPKAAVELSQEKPEVRNRWWKRREQAIASVKNAKSEEPKADNDNTVQPEVGAPIIRPMQSVPEEVKVPRERRARASSEPVSLAFADLRDRTDLDPYEIMEATDIYGIKYPAGFETEYVDYTGRAIDFSDFSLVEGLRWKHIEGASDISGVVFPASFDIDDAVFFGRCLRSCDFSAVYALKWKHIEGAEDIVAIKYPGTFDIENASFTNRNISGSDFSLIGKLTFADIADAADISGIRYPASFDCENADFTGRDISGSDFSLCQSLTWDQIKGAASIKGIIYPESFDFSKADFTGRDISGSDFSRAKSFEAKIIAGALDIRRIKYPDSFDSALADYRDKNISGSNFSRVASLRWSHIKPASDITRLVYPPQFDIDDADFSGREIDYSDFSLLPAFNWESVRLAESREGVLYPYSFDEPIASAEDVEGAMLIHLLKLYTKEFKGKMEISRFYDDISALYPGVDDVKAAELIDAATAKWEEKNGRKAIELTARSAHIGDKLFMVKLGFKLLYKKHGYAATERLLREQLGGIFKKDEQERFTKRLADLRDGKFLSDEELEALGIEPKLVEFEQNASSAAQPEQIQSEQTQPEQTQPEQTPSEQAQPEQAQPEQAQPEQTQSEPNPQGESAGQVYSFGHVDLSSIKIDDTPMDISAAEFVSSEPEQMPELDSQPVKSFTQPQTQSAQEPLAQSAQSARQAISQPAQPSAPQKPAEDFIPKPVDLGKLRQQRAAKKPVQTQRKDKLSDEEKAIRTGVMGTLLYIHQNTSEEELSNSELFSEFMKIYPGSAPKEAAAMAQFASNTLSGTDANMKAKLFMFASKASPAVKRKLLDFAHSEYVYRLSETADEEIFREFLSALCATLYDDSPEYEFSSYLRSKDILKDPPLRREPSYRRVAFESNLGKPNLYANDRYPYYRTLEQVGFTHHNFEAVRGNLLIEVSDNRYYEGIERMVCREGEPGLLQFVIIDTQMGYLYLEKRCVEEEWCVRYDDVWDAAERNMKAVGMRPKYSFASSECSSFRYIQHNLASYMLCMPELIEDLSLGRDLIITVPCREIVYIDFYDFAAVKKMLEFSSRYNSTLVINGEEFEHPFSPDVFIYHAEDKTFDRVNDENYILLGDSVSRRQVLRSVLPLNIDTMPDELAKSKTTDEVECINEEEYTIQEAVYTILRLYSEVNGDTDYTIPQNAFMAVADETYVSFDAVYPPVRGREQPDPMAHIAEAAQMAVKGGKTLCWLTVQAIQHICGDIKYETPTAAHIRETVLEQIYGENANAVWLNCATATDFAKRLDAIKRFAEEMLANHHLTILDSKVEVAMHVLTMIFHQFGRRYALGQVRRHLVKALPDIKFNYEINQSAWLPSPGEDVDVDAQSLGMMFRSFDRATQERMLTAFADAIGDVDLAEGNWPLLYFIKFVKYSYLDPVEMVERYFVKRSRLIPSQTVLKQLYYKDLNNEFVKHSRKSTRSYDAKYDDAFDEKRTVSTVSAQSDSEFDSVMEFKPAVNFDMPEIKLPTQYKPVHTFQRPDIQLQPVEHGYLEKRLSFVMEEINPQVSNALREAAHYVTKVFHVPQMMFKANDDVECELHYGIIRSREQITTLRSFAWTLCDIVEKSKKTMRDVSEKDVARAVEIVEDNNRINYKSNTYFPVLCSMPLDEGMYIPAYQEYIFFAQELLPEAKLASLFSLQDELTALAPSMKIAYDLLRAQQRGEIEPPRGVLYDALAAWSAYSFSASDAFEVVPGPQMYNYNQIQR